MYLKSIEVQGFKSFANKIVFDFHNGITGIVGPNGSGKSNVADAVRWVLGEQRVKQLRGGSMQDVIFSGTENRKPLSYAYVAITLDNSDHQLAIDYEEVTVARKLYRSGESEYLINGSNCRLKDVNELFYDTGIGKEGYSIIGQGQIDKILSGKPEERRELFDEAAGIVKFKRRKNMSLKKLEDERQNLVRVTDILSELEKQRGPLEKQSEVAKIYLKKKEELKTYDINMFLLETSRLKQLVKEVEEKLSISTHELEQASSDYENMKSEYELIEDELDVIDDKIDHFRNKLNETNLLKQQLENQIALLKEQIHSAHMTDEHFAQRREVIECEIKDRFDQLESLEKEQKDLKMKLSDKMQKENDARINLVDVQTKIAELTTEIEENKNQIIELLNNRASTRAKIQRYDTMLEQIQVRKSEMQQQFLVSQSDAGNENKNLLRYEEDLNHITSVIESLSEKSKQCNEQIVLIQRELQQRTEILHTSQTSYHRDKSRLESLKNITERYDGYGNSIRKVMELKNREKGILGVVADIVKVDKEYEAAIETALGGSIQNIVTDNEYTAKSMIGFLKKNKFGRATFLPLTSVSGKNGFLKPEVLKETGVIGVADSLVHVDEKYRGLAANLLGRTLVVDHIDTGIQIAKKYHQSLRIVTIEGDLINPGGAMTGGAFKNSSNLLSRRREIEELEKNVQSQQEKMEETESCVESLRAKRSECYAELDRMKQELQKAYVVQNTAKMNVEQSRLKISAAMEMAGKVKNETDELERQIIDINDNQESIVVELETSEKLESDLSKQITDAQNELENLRLIENDRQKDVEAVRLKTAELEQQNSFVSENVSRIHEEIEKFKAEQEQLNSSKEESSSEIKEKENQIEEIRLTIENSKELFAEIESEIKANMDEKEKLTVKHKAFLSKREDLSKRMADLDKEVFRLENKKETYEETSDKQINYMWEEYEITYSHALELRNENLTDLAAMKKQISTLKSEIKALGSVNVNAIEDFKNLSERYEFLKGQHDDLIEAEATLVKIIQELDEAMRKQFTEQFARIGEEYNKVFKELFGGGKGTLELMEGEDVLEAGIRIIAQPPGKKLQNMMQLSGGEKALTAISLLFAIQNLKPSPFCLLDEIEAALDDSNVDRFAQYLHKLTKNTQFIVITHRRGTMTSADRLYGITMQEKGVSALVSVSLIEDKLDA
ncbi:MAG: chromosome segregation protein SMC [Eubacteriales bacterium]|nr:chromosome segregation protein SMC [Eubacteriales bacterium]